jgi:hypothetical protein
MWGIFLFISIFLFKKTAYFRKISKLDLRNASQKQSAYLDSLHGHNLGTIVDLKEKGANRRTG